MKPKLSLVGLAYLCIVTTSHAADPVDLMGISVGMPLAELKQFLQSKKWPCDQVNQAVFHCRVQAADNASVQDVQIQVANALPNMPVVAMKVTFSTLENPVPSLVQKFGQPHLLQGANANWILSNGSWLDLQSGGPDRILIMKNSDLMNENAEAERKRATPYTTPKF